MSVAVYQGAAPVNFTPATLKASIVIPGHLVVYGFSFYSSNAGSQFVLMFDASQVPADTAVPSLAFDAPSKTARGISWAPQGRDFPFGLVLCTSSTDTTKTLGSADTFFDVNYDLVSDGGVPVAAEQE